MNSFPIPGLPPPDGPIPYKTWKDNSPSFYALYDLKSNLFNGKLWSRIGPARAYVTSNGYSPDDYIIVEYRLTDFQHHTVKK